MVKKQVAITRKDGVTQRYTVGSETTLDAPVTPPVPAPVANGLQATVDAVADKLTRARSPFERRALDRELMLALANDPHVPPVQQAFLRAGLHRVGDAGVTYETSETYRDLTGTVAGVLFPGAAEVQFQRDGAWGWTQLVAVTAADGSELYSMHGAAAADTHARAQALTSLLDAFPDEHVNMFFTARTRTDGRRVSTLPARG